MSGQIVGYVADKLAVLILIILEVTLWEPLKKLEDMTTQEVLILIILEVTLWVS